MPFFSPVIAANRSVGPQTIVTDQLVWMVDPKTTGNLNDLVGNINGTLVNGAYLDAENSLITDGVNDYVEFGSQTATSPVGLYNLDNFTICVWIHVLSVTDFPRVIAKGSSDGSQGWAVNTVNGFRLFTSLPITTYAPASYSLGAYTYYWQYEDWAFVVFRANKNDATNYPRDLRFTWLNAAEQSINSTTDGPATDNGTSILVPNATGNLRIGGTTNGRYQHMKFGAGMIYHKTLTDAEILQNFNVMKSAYGIQ